MGLGNGVKRFDVRDGCFKQADAILESAETNVTVLAEKPSHSTRNMVVVNGKVDVATVAFASGRQTANGTDAVLFIQHSVVVVDVNSVSLSESSRFSSFADCLGIVPSQNLGHIWKVWISRSATSIARMFFAGSKMNVHTGPVEFLVTVFTWFQFPASGAKQFFSESHIGQLLTTAPIIDSPLFDPNDIAILAGVLKTIGAFASYGKIFSGFFRRLAVRTQSFIRFNLGKVKTIVEPVSPKFLNFHFGFAEAAGYVWHISTIPHLRESRNSFSTSLTNRAGYI